jgi:hypothetical protein
VSGQQGDFHCAFSFSEPYFANADPSLASRGREQLNAFCNAVFPIDYDGSNSKKKTTATSRRRNVNDGEDDATTAKRGKSAVKTEDVDLPALASQNKARASLLLLRRDCVRL